MTWTADELAVAAEERRRLEDYASELSEAERNWISASEALERHGWQVHLLGVRGHREVRVYPPPRRRSGE
jgi:hypothetical protein